MVYRNSSTVPLLGVIFFISISCLLLLNDALKSQYSKTQAILGAYLVPENTVSTTKTFVDCSFFKKSTYSNQFAGTSLLPGSFPVAQQSSTLCGSIFALDANYFTTTLSDQILLGYYSQKLKMNKCSVDSQLAKDDHSSSLLTYYCPNIYGSIMTYPSVAAYTITLHHR